MRARERLTYWTSPEAVKKRQGSRQFAHPYDLARLDFLTENALKASTLDSYGAGLAHWIAWCDLRLIDESERLPASSKHLSLFLAYMSDKHSESVIKHTMSGLRHWHEINLVPWRGDLPYVKKIRHAASMAAPVRSRPPRPPVTTEHMSALRNGLDFTNTFDSAVYAAATSAFWGVCRLGELTVPSLGAFDPHFHVARGTFISRKSDSNGDPVSIRFRIPWSKTTRWLGADIILSAISVDTCPVLAFEHHLLANAAVPAEHGLFSYMHRGKARYMTKAAFLARCDSIWSGAGLEKVLGHSFRIGGASEHVDRGLSFDLLQIQGRWTSDAFLRYLRKMDNVVSREVRLLDRLQASRK